MRRRGLFALATAALASTTGCTKSEILDFAMRGAPHPALRRGERVGSYEILGGDLHCHVLPPDAPWHVTRTLPETASLAEAESLDFVVLTPHVPSRFFADPEERDWVLETQAELRARVAAMRSDVLFVVGMEYTDHRWGHVGLAFADVAEVLEDLPITLAHAHPERFFERWSARGGVTTINHPVARPIARSGILQLRYDLSWRPFTKAEPLSPPPEIAWLTEHTHTIETFNLSISHLRDQFFLHDEERTLREGAHLVDRQARAEERPIAPVGGSDSHGGWLRPTTWVLSSGRTKDAIRDALVSARTCVRGPEGCTLEARAAGAWVTVGSSLSTGGRAETIDVRTRGGRATYYVNGEVAARGVDGEIVPVRVPGRCALVRAVVGRSWSAPIYVDCPWANRAP